MAETLAAKPSAETSVDRMIADMLHGLGRRVREARADAKLSRRALSAASGVSERYLAQLESGSGNVSLALLLRISVALDRPLEWFLADDGRWSEQARAILPLLARAGAADVAAARDALEPANASARRKRRIAFIGLRGAGKSTLGRRSAERLKLPFVELNEAIEQDCGMALNEVIALYGEEGYRDLERDALRNVIERHDAVTLAVAGGIVANPDSYADLLANFHTIWLKALPEEHMARVRAQGDERPMAGAPNAMAQLRAILDAREALYGKADAVVDTSTKREDDSLEDVLVEIERRGFLSYA